MQRKGKQGCKNVKFRMYGREKETLEHKYVNVKKQKLK